MIHVFRWLTPGPQFALIVRNSLVYSRKTGFWTAVGFAIGNLINITFAVTGVAIIIANSSIANNVMKYAGSGYLVYLGLKTIFMKIHFQNLTSKEKYQDIGSLSAIKIGLATNLLNPNAPLFFISVFGALISSKTPYWVVLTLMIAMPLNTLFMASMWSLLFTHKLIKSLYMKFEPILNKFLGVVLILLAVSMLLKK
ncbi:MAG: Lysine exporter protein (LYSE/YGGA) [Candidatus Roizmanbacteria bacterium GW2011_GWA2_36_23]|uniref:Lysine exporter protein (LYSE/YGGA) n=1 Tax=Candidatus Roizmanbacteria bacterium GW2011_GWA2_36_23 TaxID=1618480 RepID=A0A0G0GNH8_9BACT|nr:MAG: Lysine exporter protein (LYSE/YGGA) [Candidatus Roizmanbacteria bacterium GW2011_GWA2_36_23]